MNETTTSPSAVLEPESQPVKRGRGRPPKSKPIVAVETAPVIEQPQEVAHVAAPEPVKDALAELEHEAAESPLKPLNDALEMAAEKLEKIVEITRAEGMERALADGSVEAMTKIDAAYDSPPAEPAAEPPPPPTPPIIVSAAPTGEPAKLLYVKKVQAGMPFFVNKEKLNFEMLGNNVGVGIFNEATQADKCEAIRKAAAARRGGVVIIDEPTYQGLKKKLGPALARKSNSPLKVFRPDDHLPKLKNLPAASAAAASVGSTAAPTGMSQTGAVGGSSAPVKFTPSTRRFGPRPIAPPPPLARPID